MKSFLLLILSLITGCGASSKVRGCPGGWVEFTCNYSKKHEKYQKVIELLKSKETVFQGRALEVNNGKFSLYHDEKSQNVRVTIKNLTSSDKGDYWYKFKGSKPNGKTEVEVEDDGCQTSLHQITYRSAETTITCDYVQDEEEKRPAVPFFCKEEADTCVDVSIKSKGKFTFAHSSRAFNLSFSNVQVTDRGVYWCGLNSSDGKHRSGLRRIQLEVKDIDELTRTITVGKAFTYLCHYKTTANEAKKIICKEDDRSNCKPLIRSGQPVGGKFSMEDDKKGNINVTMRNLNTGDSGTYWCKTEGGRQGTMRFHKLVMIVVPSPTSTPSIHRVSVSSGSLTQPTASPEGHGTSLLTSVIIAVVCVTVSALIFVLVYKRFERSKNTKNGEEQNKTEDHGYEEIQDCPQKPDSGTALTTVYVTADFPTHLSASTHDSHVQFQNGSAELSDNTYSTVGGDGQYPTY